MRGLFLGFSGFLGGLRMVLILGDTVVVRFFVCLLENYMLVYMFATVVVNVAAFTLEDPVGLGY